MEAERVAELKALLKSETGAQQVVLDLRDLTLVDRDAVRFLESCEGASSLRTVRLTFASGSRENEEDVSA